MKPVLYLMRDLPGPFQEWLRPRFEIRGGGRRPAPAEEIARDGPAAAVLVPSYLDRVDDALLDHFPEVRHVASYGVGVNHIDLEACRRRKLLVTNTPGVVTVATADLAMGLLLAAARRICEGDRLVRAGGWTEVDPGAMLGWEVSGKTLGIVGFGRIGQAVARRAQAFDMRVLYASPRAVGFPGARHVSLEELLAESDFVSLHTPLTPATQNLVNRERLARMRRGAILVNTSRGGVLDDAAVAEALAGGRLASAGLDVFRDEPRVPEVYLGLPNVVLTPHVGSGTVETRTAMSRMVADEVLRVADGQPPLHAVA